MLVWYTPTILSFCNQNVSLSLSNIEIYSYFYLGIMSSEKYHYGKEIEGLLDELPSDSDTNDERVFMKGG